MAVWANPAALPLLRVEADERLIHAAHTPAGIVAVLERDGERLIQIDNHYALGGTRDRVHQERQGHVPLLLHPDAGRVLFLGSATGGSAAAALLHPVRSLSLVELVPGVARAAARFFGAANRDVYRSRRTEVVLDDARSFVRSTRARFDLIVGDLFVPWRSGTGALFTLEHFAAIRDRLAADGLFCQWLPLYQLSEEEFRVIAATFLDVFPRAAIFRGDFYGAFPIVALIGWAGTPPSPERIGAASVRLAEEPVDDRWVTSPIGFWSLYVGPLRGLGPALAEVPRNRDDRPELEFRAARTHAGGARGKRDPFVALRWIAFVDRLRAVARRSGDDVFGDLPPAAARAAAGGQALQLAGALYTAGRVDESSSAVAAAATLLPSHLLADAPPDPTAADVWPADR